MPQFNLAEYESVKSRIDKFWEENPQGRIITRFLSDPNILDTVLMQALIYKNSNAGSSPDATGTAFEKVGTTFKDGANVTSHVENCETSAIGRALANMGYQVSKDSPRPSQSEMSKVNNYTPKPAPKVDPNTLPMDPAHVKGLNALCDKKGVSHYDVKGWTVGKLKKEIAILNGLADTNGEV